MREKGRVQRYFTKERERAQGSVVAGWTYRAKGGHMLDLTATLVPVKFEGDDDDGGGEI